MQDDLVIVEGPATAKTIEKFLGKDYKVMSSYGHIRDLKKKELSIDVDTLMPQYEIPEEKKRVVSELKASCKKAKKMRTVRERLFHGICAKFSDLTRRKRAVSYSMKSRKAPSLRLFRSLVSSI